MRASHRGSRRPPRGHPSKQLEARLRWLETHRAGVRGDPATAFNPSFIANHANPVTELRYSYPCPCPNKLCKLRTVPICSSTLFYKLSRARAWV